MKRRQYLAILAAGSVPFTAGCNSDSSSSDPTSENPVGEKAAMTVPAPKVDLPDEWAVTTPDTDSHVFQEGSFKGLVDYKAVGHTKRYENKDVRQRVKEETFGKRRARACSKRNQSG